ncbi:MAG: hypothetical protein AB9856_00545 [Cellulosilyticaceae bacterium]
MEWISIYCIVVSVGIILDLFRLLLIKVFNLEVQEFSIFMGPKVFNKCIGDALFILRGVPYGSSMVLRESFLESTRKIRIAITYLPEFILFVITSLTLSFTSNQILFLSSLFLMSINGLSVLLSIIFDKSQVCYRYKNSRL